MKRRLPVINIEGTDFLVDVNKFELREKDNPKNRISVFEMMDVPSGYIFEYHPDVKNIAPYWSEGVTRMVKIPEMVMIDPIGMAKKHKLKPEDLKGKSDLDIMVDRKAIDKRINQGMLPTIEIAAHIFYVDIRMNKLRPKDDSLSNGIEFSNIGTYYDQDTRTYTIPYNPKKREFQEIEYANLKEFPKDLIAVSFPSERLLDRIGWNRKYGFEVMHGVKQNGLQLNFKAQVIPWEKTFLSEIIRIKGQIETNNKNNAKTENRTTEPYKQQKRVGRKM